MIANGEMRVKLITPAQRRKIFASRRELGLTDAALYFLLHQVTGRTRISSLTQDEAALFIDELVSRGASGPGRGLKSDRRQAPAGQDPPAPRPAAPPLRPEGLQGQLPGTNVIPLASDEQLRAIDGLLQQLNLGWDSAEFVSVVRQAGIRRGVKTSAEAAKVIAALQAIVERQKRTSCDLCGGGAAPRG